MRTFLLILLILVLFNSCKEYDEGATITAPTITESDTDTDIESNSDTDTSTDTVWTKQVGTSGNEEFYDIIIDSSDNLYVTGIAGGSLDGTTNQGGGDILTIKYNSLGNRQWTKQIGNSVSNYGKGIAVDSSGNVYVTGETLGDLDGNTNLGGVDAFLIKYNSSGTKQWSRLFGSIGGDYGKDVAIDSLGNVYLTGSTENGSEIDLFLVKFNSSGTQQWARQLGSVGGAGRTNEGNGIVIDSSDNIYIAGHTIGDFDGNTSQGSEDALLIKYNTSGTKQWSQQFGTSELDTATGISLDSSGFIYITGYTRGGFGGNTHQGGNDIFLVKFDSAGTTQWTRQLGSSDHETTSGLILDNSGNIYITGWAYGGLDGNTNQGGIDIFLVKYNSSGTKEWTKQPGTSTGDFGRNVAVDSAGNVYIAGSTNGGMDGNSNNGGNDGIIIKYNSSGEKQ